MPYAQRRRLCRPPATIAAVEAEAVCRYCAIYYSQSVYVGGLIISSTDLGVVVARVVKGHSGSDLSHRRQAFPVANVLCCGFCYCCCKHRMHITAAVAASRFQSAARAPHLRCLTGPRLGMIGNWLALAPSTAFVLCACCCPTRRICRGPPLSSINLAATETRIHGRPKAWQLTAQGS